MKSIIGSETIYFVGGYYEKKNSEITKYYFAGASRVAMRKTIVPQTDTLTYLFGDHLGSTSFAMDASTGSIVETRYKPWGEVRYTSQDMTLPTRYTFTGQYSHMDDSATDLGAAGFGLMFYNARWYDPLTGRFAQADTVVPGGMQGLDRYAYVNNSPLNYVDPSGHFTVDAIKSYISSQCAAEHDMGTIGYSSCYSQMLYSWQADGEWWNMLLAAKNGDVLFGTCSNYLGNCSWTATFEGGEGGSLTGISVNVGTSSSGVTYLENMTLNDVFKGNVVWGSRRYGDWTPSSVSWIGFYRPSTESGKSGSPAEWFIRKSSGYTLTQGAPGAKVSTITEEGISTMAGAAATDICLGFWLSALCGAAGYFLGTTVSDALDTQSTDYHYQVGPVYFNFQCTYCSSPDGRNYTMEYTSYR